MADYKLTIGPHPSQAQHPITREPLFRDGKPVPLFDDHFSILLDDRIIAYVLPNKNVAFLVPEQKLTSVVVKDALALVKETFGDVAKHSAPPMPIEVEEETDDEPESVLWLPE